MSNLQVCLDVLATCVSIAHLMSLVSFKCGGSNGNSHREGSSTCYRIVSGSRVKRVATSSSRVGTMYKKRSV